jgi:methylenetetrahydrofolate reductase (NADPH)
MSPQNHNNVSPLVSVEFFPPKTEVAQRQFGKVVERFIKLNPEYFSVTYGAGGSTKERTIAALQQLVEKTTIPATPHISCVGESKNEISELLTLYRGLGINKLVVLRGDLPSGMGGRNSGDFHYAVDLVKFIRETTGDYFHITVAAYPEVHPQARSCDDDFHYFCEKVRAGADCAVTQFFFNADSYFYFLERCHKEGITIPIFPGIMPIYSSNNLLRFAEGCGAEIPKWIRVRLESFADDEHAVVSFGEEVVLAMCKRLLNGGAPGLHFYSLNRSEVVTRIWKELLTLQS